ncbi:hypothetical protein C3747_80g66c [Trypanosoma cruzi]|uniref:MYND-type domain-containing protein n=2 Tax=Trypanosoma cruzi TaxID=5693 RepID=Q4CVD6_TRYCC|nr:hypothetical protein, conserved [Trypanosoma cruzi]EAN84239.1 hypothetical protein, conserved [Trypanosoma cruzi]KAF8282742.1 hypothetical protein TcYC6_0023600 [Trypanosoma cruzi]PWV09294.1 hypothetical protein C3747_80g66c [Trypanosoma cruzi]RNC50103.1 hypothetical protein TcCL_ESM12873 [Trypanosoma cruzi]|eukprot:XP_806090.1 hypothetical protein [Trypanosoma cruzi strain CL Brener]
MSSTSLSSRCTSSSSLVPERDVTIGVVASLQSCLEQQRELFMRVKKCEEDIEKLKFGLLRRAGEVLSPPPEAQESGQWKTGCGNDENVGAEKMCDYCFKLTLCRPCPQCQREWYCSSPCQRLRSYLHRPFCRRRERVE